MTKEIQEGGSFPDEYIGEQEALYGLFPGRVVNRDDPHKRGRVKVAIPGLLKETRFAEPLAMPGAGGPPGGGFCVPEVKAQVAVGFFMGDLDAPYYFAGPPAMKETPDAVSSRSKSDTPKVRAFETATFEIFIEDTETSKKLTLRTKSSTDGAADNNEIEIDAIDGSVSITASQFLILSAPRIGVDGAVITMGERLVKKVGIAI